MSDANNPEFLVIPATCGDVSRLLLGDRLRWPGVLLLPEWAAKSEIFESIHIWSVTRNAMVGCMQVKSWTQKTELLWQPEIASFDLTVEPEEAPMGLEALLGERICGEPDAITFINLSEPRLFPLHVYELDWSSPEALGLITGINQHQYIAFRSHPAWKASVRELANECCWSDLYEGCDKGQLIELGLSKGWATLKEIDATRREATPA